MPLSVWFLGSSNFSHSPGGDDWFRTEFVEKIVGANAHISIYKKTLSTDIDKTFNLEDTRIIIQTLKKKKTLKRRTLGQGASSS